MLFYLAAETVYGVGVAEGSHHGSRRQENCVAAGGGCGRDGLRPRRDCQPEGCSTLRSTACGVLHAVRRRYRTVQ